MSSYVKKARPGGTRTFLNATDLFTALRDIEDVYRNFDKRDRVTVARAGLPIIETALAANTKIRTKGPDPMVQRGGVRTLKGNLRRSMTGLTRSRTPKSYYAWAGPRLAQLIRNKTYGRGRRSSVGWYAHMAYGGQNAFMQAVYEPAIRQSAGVAQQIMIAKAFLIMEGKYRRLGCK